MVELRKNESKTLLTIEKLGGKASVQQISEEGNLSKSAIMRAALTLKDQELIEILERKQTTIELNDEGRFYAENGLPERRLINALKNLDGKAPIKKTVKKAGLQKQSVPIALGWLRRKKWATINTKTDELKLTKPEKEFADEQLLELLNKKGKVLVEDLDTELQSEFKVLKRRKLLKTHEETRRTIEITKNGWKTIEQGITVPNKVTQLTPELIISGKWREKEIARFDVTKPGPKIYPAKKHPVQQIIQRVKEIFVEMGFQEIRGPIVETAFWNFDALFQPQDHPAREMHDTFYLEYPKTGELPERNLVKKVADTHEDGWKTGSTGWQYSWSSEEAKKLILRTHTTATTIRYLAENKEPPVKVFSVDRVYRNEKMDYQNISEFHQVEGIIMDREVTLRDLIGTLKEFYLRLGFNKIRFWPSYFPYTEPSAQSMVYIPKIEKWVELGGMGMFRPEVLIPLGIKHPVLAWGLGLERLIMLKLNVKDMRFLYENDLGWIRRTPTCQ
ncbi:MAG: phenylalanine--tRNA ligase subunit alpha [Candidatus Bathyarchaeota archaeon]|jgi:phenylalanyl-tRNA synthetase alpha chain